MKSHDVSVLRFSKTHSPWRRDKASVALLALCLCACVLTGCSDDNPSAPVSKFRIVSDVTEPFCSADNAACEATVDIPFHIEGGDSAADYTFEIHLDLLGDGTVDEDLAVQDVLTDACPDYLVTYTLPLGGHRMLVDIVDGTGKVHSGAIAFDVVDCRAPTPVCINGLAVELQPLTVPEDVDGDGDIDSLAMFIWAMDFSAAPLTDCSMPIVYSVNRKGEIADIAQSTIVMTCDDVGTVEVEIHAWDTASNPLAPQPDGSIGGPNHDFCETYILVLDHSHPCN